MRNSNKKILYIVVSGFFVRILFIVFGTHHYFDMKYMFHSGDTAAWLGSFISLVENGTYTINTESPYGYFGRMPGYAFIIGPIYYLFGKNTMLAYYFVEFLQLIADSINIALIFSLTNKLFKNLRIALISSFLYAVYPFVIVWVSAIYSEIFSLFFLLSGLNVFVGSKSNKKYFLSGILLGVGILLRPQIIFLIPILSVYLLYINRVNVPVFLARTFCFGLGVMCTYGLWPARNYINYGKIIPVQDTRAFKNWNEDVVSFMNFIYSVKTDWQPQFYQILENRDFDIPPIIAKSYEDSMMLVKAVDLAKNCGSGFSHWTKYYWKEPITNGNCNEEIAQLFNTLRERQIKNNPWNYYLWVPLGNLKKAVFKMSLTDSSTIARKSVSLLLLLRSVALLLGLCSILYIVFSKNALITSDIKTWSLVFLGYFVLAYFTLCFGTGTQMRNIEMRYFIHVDVLLLIPLSYLLYNVALKMNLIRESS